MKKYIISALSALIGGIVGIVAMGRVDKMEISKLNESSKKHLSLFLMMNQWVKVKQEGKNLGDYFECKGINKIAIYGMSYVGETLISELKETNIEVAYGIDERADSLYASIDIVTIDNALDNVDAIVVTAITFFDEIEEKLCKKVTCPVISLAEILDEMKN